jgi:cytochrome c oxidase subunit II
MRKRLAAGGARLVAGHARLAAGLAAAPLLAGCGWQSILDPQSPAPARIELLWWIAFASTGILSAVVIGGLLYAVARARRAAAAEAGGGAAASEQRFILLAGGAFPAVFLVGFLAITVHTGTVVSEPPAEPELTIEVIGHKFWWEVRYPDEGIVTANEIHIPAGSPVEVLVTSADVIHSFWVPQLAPGKVDMNPGRTNRIWMMAEAPGRYRGQCTEFCGTQHALMSLLVVASPPDEFEAWVAARRTPPPPPEDPLELLGRTVFFTAGCASCHAIGGVSVPREAGSPGPDLTDLASRETLGALTIENTRANLGGWILDPHQFKPGVRMPATRMGGTELRALLAYLETLR